ncbi:MAG TPA: hypothetical protein PLP27_08280 [Crocinitomicaceae bacterium]|nr:hypothetical protein [Crocinitomicaceae bacterium]
MNKIAINVIIYAVMAGLLFFGGMLANSKMQRPVKLECPPCPDLKCPPNVQVNTLPLDEVRKMKIKGGFTFAPVYNGTVVMSADTLKK